jgi:pathogenesis-related protein 1
MFETQFKFIIMRKLYFTISIAVFFLLVGTNSGISQKIEVYTMEGCGRCAYTIEYLNEKNIQYTEFSTSNDENNSKMWNILYATNKYKGGSITMPVVVINGEVNYNIKDLKGFLTEKLSANNKNEEIKPAEDISIDVNQNEYNSNGNLSAAQIKEFVDRHNYYRQQVGSENIEWSEDLAKFALEWGKHLSSIGCEMEHRPDEGKWGTSYGENLYWCSGIEATPTDAVDSWGSEKSMYDGKVIGNSNFEAGHYTQMIWAKTTQVGCAIVQCSSGDYIVVCNYNPAGNYIGQSPYK